MLAAVPPPPPLPPSPRINQIFVVAPFLLAVFNFIQLLSNPLPATDAKLNACGLWFSAQLNAYSWHLVNACGIARVRRAVKVLGTPSIVIYLIREAVVDAAKYTGHPEATTLVAGSLLLAWAHRVFPVGIPQNPVRRGDARCSLSLVALRDYSPLLQVGLETRAATVAVFATSLLRVCERMCGWVEVLVQRDAWVCDDFEGCIKTYNCARIAYCPSGRECRSCPLLPTRLAPYTGAVAPPPPASPPPHTLQSASALPLRMPSKRSEK